MEHEVNLKCAYSNQ